VALLLTVLLLVGFGVCVYFVWKSGPRLFRWMVADNDVHTSLRRTLLVVGCGAFVALAVYLGRLDWRISQPPPPVVSAAASSGRADPAVSGIPLPEIHDSADTHCDYQTECTDAQFSDLRDALQRQWRLTPEWLRAECASNSTYPTVEHCILSQTVDWLKSNPYAQAPWVNPNNYLPRQDGAVQQTNDKADAVALTRVDKLLHPFDLVQDSFTYKGKQVSLDVRSQPIFLNGQVFQYQRANDVFVQRGFTGLRFVKRLSEDQTLYEINGLDADTSYSASEFGQLLVVIPMEQPQPLALDRDWEIEPLGLAQGTNALGGPVSVPLIRFLGYSTEK
jgi:hypothetical protein